MHELRQNATPTLMTTLTPPKYIPKQYSRPTLRRGGGLTGGGIIKQLQLDCSHWHKYLLFYLRLDLGRDVSTEEEKTYYLTFDLDHTK